MRKLVQGKRISSFKFKFSQLWRLHNFHNWLRAISYLVLESHLPEWTTRSNSPWVHVLVEKWKKNFWSWSERKTTFAVTCPMNSPSSILTGLSNWQRGPQRSSRADRFVTACVFVIEPPISCGNSLLIADDPISCYVVILYFTTCDWFNNLYLLQIIPFPVMW